MTRRRLSGAERRGHRIRRHRLADVHSIDELGCGVLTYLRSLVVWPQASQRVENPVSLRWARIPRVRGVSP
ncbi:MAG: hypothetical protein WBV64_02040, partial [Mycobacterium sp.]